MNNLALIEDYISFLQTNREWLMRRIESCARTDNPIELSSNPDNKIDFWIDNTAEALAEKARTSNLILGNYSQIPNTQEFPLSHFSVLFSDKIVKGNESLEFWMRWLKFIRNSYLDLITAGELDSDLQSIYRNLTERSFDEIELEILKNSHLFNSEAQINKAVPDNDYLPVFDNLLTPIFILDKNYKVLDYNRAAKDFLPSLEREQLLPDANIYSAPGFKNVIDSISNFIRHNKQQTFFEQHLNTPQGKRYFRIQLKDLANVNNEYQGLLVMFEDLTKYHTANMKLKDAKAKAEDADRLKTAFLANMSHEIRTPMNAIIGFTELMINGNYEEQERKEYLELIRRSSNDLLNIIEDIIDIAKLESKQLKIKYKVCSPYELFTDLYAVFNESLVRYGIENSVKLILNVDENDKKLQLYTDGERLKQVVSNLLGNAVKFTSEGFIEFGYRIVNNTHLYFFVRDSGSGIPSEMKERIFERFIQLEEHLASNSGGAGLGLAICKNIIQLLGGKIWVESIPDKGSDFYFQLPIREVPANHKQTKNVVKLKNFSNKYDWSDKCVLIAEDDMVNFQYFAEVLQITGIKILPAKNGLEAINLSESTPVIDLILMDIKMPEVDGIEATKYITRIRPEIPIIATTAYAMDGDKAKCLDAGCSSYLTKPIAKDILLNVMEKYFAISEKRIKEKSSFYSSES